MTSQHNADCIRTTHIGSLPRPHGLLDLMSAKYANPAYDRVEYGGALTGATVGTIKPC